MPKKSSHIRIDIDAVYDLSDQLNGTEFKFLTILQAHTKNGIAFPGIKRLAALMRCSERHIRRLRAKLESLGLIITQARFANNGRQRSNLYRIIPLYGGRGADIRVQEKAPNRGGHLSPAELITNATIEMKTKAKTILRSNGVVTITRETLAWQLARM